MSAYMPDSYIQIDIKRIEGNAAIGNLYTGARCVKIAMAVGDYESLMRDGFFTRDGKSEDSAGVINTTKVFVPQL
jgi:hypothetical protein